MRSPTPNFSEERDLSRHKLAIRKSHCVVTWRTPEVGRLVASDAVSSIQTNLRHLCILSYSSSLFHLFCHRHASLTPPEYPKPCKGCTNSEKEEPIADMHGIMQSRRFGSRKRRVESELPKASNRGIQNVCYSMPCWVY
jgi:hypothetical protein